MGVKATSVVQVDLGSGFVTLNDIMWTEGIAFNYGIPGTSMRDRVASTGTLGFSLNNGAGNSGAKVGYYSPGHTNALSGWDIGTPIRVAITYGATTYYKWRGWVDALNILPGKRNRRVRVHCVDWMDHAARAKLKNVAVQIDKRSDEIFDLIVDEVDTAPPAEEFGYASDTYPFALDNAKDEKVSVLAEMQRLAMSELGYIFTKGDTAQGGTLVFESRMRRSQTLSSVFTMDDDVLSAMPSSYERDDVLNYVQSQIHPRKVDAAATTVLFELQRPTAIPPNTSTTFNCPYRDPSQKAARVGGTDMVTPAATTDYTLNSEDDDTGTDLTSQLSVSATFGGNSAEVTVTNNGPGDGFITKLQLRGRGIYDFENILFEAEDTTSQTTYGKNTFKLDMPYQSDPNIGLDAAYYALNLNKDAQSRIQGAGFIANRTDAMMTAALAREISDRVTVTESVTGIDSDYFINAVSVRIRGDLIQCAWVLAPADTQEYWLLETTGYTELGQTTTLAYGLFVPAWQLNVSEFGVSTYINAA